MSMRVEAVVSGDVLTWRYFYGGDEWKQSIPLAKMLPYPMISINHGSRWKYMSITLLSPLIAFGVALWFDFGPAISVAIPTMLFLVFAYRLSPYLAGPIEWATFDTRLQGKTIYVFRGGTDSGFDQFISALDNAIIAANELNEKAEECDQGHLSG